MAPEESELDQDQVVWDLDSVAPEELELDQDQVVWDLV